MIQENLTILIILYQEKIDVIKKCLDQLKQFKIIIIDNANDKELKNKITKDYNIQKYLLNKKNIGFSKAANQGILVCDTEYMFLLGADCIINYQDIEQLMLAKKKYENCFLTSPTFYNLNGQHDFNGGPSYEEGLPMNVLKNFGDVCVSTVLTTAILFKIEDIKNIGLFDNLEQNITLIEWPELIKNKPLNRIDLFFEYTEDYKERSLIIKTNGRLKKHEF